MQKKCHRVKFLVAMIHIYSFALVTIVYESLLQYLCMITQKYTI